MFEITFAARDPDTVELCMKHDHGCLRLCLSAANCPWGAIATWGLELAGNDDAEHFVEFDDKKFRYRLTARKMNIREWPCRRFQVLRCRLQKPATSALTHEVVFKACEDYGRFIRGLCCELSRFIGAWKADILHPQSHGDSCDEQQVSLFLDRMKGMIID
ncbi:MAG: hypothetical protein U1F81_10725 [Verrucomicrobiaceae bacterium]